MSIAERATMVALHYGWALWALAGAGLIRWARVSLPAGTNPMPVGVETRTAAGPYRWSAHPMYLGNVMLVMGCAGQAAGIWNALAVGVLAILVMGEWAGREASGS